MNKHHFSTVVVDSVPIAGPCSKCALFSKIGLLLDDPLGPWRGVSFQIQLHHYKLLFHRQPKIILDSVELNHLIFDSFRYFLLIFFSSKYFSLFFFYYLFTVGISLLDVAQVMRIVWDEKTAVCNSRLLISPDEYFNDPRPIIVALSRIEGEDPCVSRPAFDISLTRDEEHLRPM